jgi:pimeloyl-ACP methyl ester carboxylesterase
MAAATTLGTPLGRRIKVVEHGTGTPVVFLHSGVGSAGEWKQVFSLWPEGYRLVAIEAYRDGTGPGVAGRRSLDDYADQVYGVAEHLGVSMPGRILVGRRNRPPRGCGGARARGLARGDRA